MQPTLFLVLCSLVTGGLSVQTWLEQPSSTFVNPGGEIILACRINNKQGDCRWEKRKEDGQVEPLGFYPGKREWWGDQALGDCSIRVLDAEYEYDNGKYVCQVTASGFKATDTLISHEAIVSVRVPPRTVMLRRQTDSGAVGSVVSGVAGEEVGLECLVEGGNPAPNLHWYLGRQRLAAATVREDQARGAVISQLDLRVEKERRGESVRCVVEHSALQSDMEASAELDIQYPPEVSLRPSDLRLVAVEGETVNVSCRVDSSPPASVVWRHGDTGDVVTSGHRLLLTAISRARAGRYICEATNTVGSSQSQEILLDVKYGASQVSVEPQAGSVQRLLGSQLELNCQAEASPAPSYRWVHHTNLGAVTISHHSKVVLEEVSYEDQGEYYCEVENVISTTRSEPVSLTVHGPPRVNSDNNKHLFLIEGRDAKIEVEFCGSPLPKQTWQIASVETKLSLVAGTSHDDYTVEKERMSNHNNCYVSVLHINSIDQHKAKDYVLKLENEHGEEIHRAHVTVGEEISKKTLIGSLVGVAATFLLVLCLTVCWCRRCCKSDKQRKQDPERPL